MKISKLLGLSTLILASFTAATALAQTATGTVELSQLVPADTDAYYELNTGATNPFSAAMTSFINSSVQANTTMNARDQQTLKDVLTNALKNNKISMALKYKTITTDDYSYETSDGFISMHVSTDDLKKLSTLNNISKNDVLIINDLVIFSNEQVNLAKLAEMYNKHSVTPLSQNEAFRTVRQKDLAGSFFNMYLKAKDGFLKTEGISLVQNATGFNFSFFVEGDEAKFMQLNINLDSYKILPDLYKWVNSKNIMFFAEEGNLKQKILNLIKLNLTDPAMLKQFNDWKASLITEANLDFDKELLPLLTDKYSISVHQTGQIYPAFTMMLNLAGDLNIRNNSDLNIFTKGATALSKLVDYADKTFNKMEKEQGVDFYNKTTTSFNGTAFYQMTFDQTKFADADPLLKNLPKEKVVITVNIGITRDGQLIVTNAPNINDVYTTDKIGMMNNATFKSGFSNPQEIVNSLNYINFDSLHSYVSTLMNSFDAPKESKTFTDGLLNPWHDAFAKSTSSATNATFTGFVNVDVAGLNKYGDLFSNYFNSQLQEIPTDNVMPPLLPIPGLPDFGPLPVVTPMMNMMENPRFCDVRNADWYSKYVNKLADEGIISGYSDGCFHPSRPITRAEFVKIAIEASGLGKGGHESQRMFKDVDNDQWYAGYVNSAMGYGFINGYSDGTFRPNAPITRAEALQLLYNMSGTLKQVNALGAPVSSIISFKDVGANDWFMPAVAGAYHSGLVQGDGNHMFNPNRNLTRAEAAKIIKLFRAIMKEENGAFLVPMPMMSPSPMAAPTVDQSLVPGSIPNPPLNPTPMYPTTPAQQAQRL